MLLLVDLDIQPVLKLSPPNTLATIAQFCGKTQQMPLEEPLKFSKNRVIK